MYLIYITVKDKSEAESIAENLLSENLIACANIINSITSIYKWEGEICKESEVILLIKTSKALLSEVKMRIKSLHSYEIPAILPIKIDSCDKDFIKWVETSVKLAY